MEATIIFYGAAKFIQKNRLTPQRINFQASTARLSLAESSEKSRFFSLDNSFSIIYKYIIAK